MRVSDRWARGLLFIGTIAISAVVLAGDGSTPGTGKTLSDDKCVAQCDETSDKCMQTAAHDTAKQKQCDENYDQCLRKCG